MLLFLLLSDVVAPAAYKQLHGHGVFSLSLALVLPLSHTLHTHTHVHARVLADVKMLLCVCMLVNISLVWSGSLSRLVYLVGVFALWPELASDLA